MIRTPDASWFLHLQRHHASTSLRSRGRCCLPAWPFALPWLHICRFFWSVPDGLYHVGYVIFIYIAVPDAACMEYVPKFEPFLGWTLVNIPYIYIYIYGASAGIIVFVFSVLSSTTIWVLGWLLTIKFGPLSCFNPCAWVTRIHDQDYRAKENIFEDSKI